MGYSNLSKFPEGHTRFHILRSTFPSDLGNTESLVFIRAWSSIFSSETVVTHINQLFMFLVAHAVFIVAHVMSFRECLSIIARSELKPKKLYFEQDFRSSLFGVLK